MLLFKTSKQAEIAYNRWKLVIIGIFLAYAVYCAKITGWIWFSYHPLLMIIGATTLTPIATIIKRIGGAENTRIHGKLLFLAFAFLSGGYYVIYSNKEMMNKAHLTSFHAKVGFAGYLGYAFSCLGGLFGLHPDYGHPKVKTNKTVRFLHKWFSRGWILLALYACYTGFEKIESNNMYHYLFGASLACLIPFIS